jgi:N-acetylneuraminic acid mutarotase
MKKVQMTVFYFIPASMLVVMVIAATLVRTSSASTMQQNQRDKLTLQQRITYQQAVEEIYWQHRIWPKENHNPKPALREAMPITEIQAKVEDYLRKSKALESYWQRPIKGEQLQAEMDRMASQTKQPGVLREIFAALGNDPYVIAECFVRQTLADRLIREWYASDEKFGGDVKSQKATTVEWRKEAFDSWWQKTSREIEEAEENATYEYRPAEIGSATMACANDSWTATNTFNAPLGRLYHTAIWTGSEMIIWGGLLFDGGKYNPSTDTWSPLSTVNAPSFRVLHTAVWTGSEMITWGGNDGFKFDTGGKYNPSTNTWTATSTMNAPSARDSHTAIWTGNEMIIWGGISGTPINPNYPNTGGKYNPSTNTWTEISTINAPPGRYEHTAIWTGSEMIIWGGFDTSVINPGRRYNPSTDIWTSMSTKRAPFPVAHHTAVWTGSEMIIWGGLLGLPTNIGGRYNPSTNTWMATSLINTPSPRRDHSVVWTGSEMIVWGGQNMPFEFFNDGGRYNPNTNSWTAINTAGRVPSARYDHTAIWTGSEMIVFGGFDAAGPTSTGGVYLVSAYTLSPTSQSIPSSGGNYIVNVTAGGQCSWTAVSNAPWITIISSSIGSGNSRIDYLVDANLNTNPRTGTMTIAGQTFTVIQAGNLPVPRITSATVKGKKLLVNGENFDPGAELLLNGEKQKKVSNDLGNPGSRLIAKKSGKKIQVGDKLQVRNPNGTVSEEFTFIGQ